MFKIKKIKQLIIVSISEYLSNQLTNEDINENRTYNLLLVVSTAVHVSLIIKKLSNVANLYNADSLLIVVRIFNLLSKIVSILGTDIIKN